MNLYWIYDIPNWQFFIICTLSFIGFSLLGAFLFRQFFEKWMGLKASNNEVVGNFLAVSGLFYGITLGLISVGMFENFQQAESSGSQEATALNDLYRDVGLLENPEKLEMKILLKDYAQYVIGEGWADQQKGIIPKSTSKFVSKFEFFKWIHNLKRERQNCIC